MRSQVRLPLLFLIGCAFAINYGGFALDRFLWGSSQITMDEWLAFSGMGAGIVGFGGELWIALEAKERREQRGTEP